MNTFGKALKKLRLDKGLSLKELGELCDPPIDGGYLSKLENGKIGVGPNIISRLAKAMGISEETLEKLASPDKHDRMVELYTHFIDGYLRAGQDENDWSNINNYFSLKNKADWDLLIPEFRKGERIPAETRVNLINGILALELPEVEFFQKTLALYKEAQEKLNASSHS